MDEEEEKEVRSEGYRAGLEIGRKKALNKHFRKGVWLMYISVAISYLSHADFVDFVEITAYYWGLIFFIKGTLKFLEGVDFE